MKDQFIPYEQALELNLLGFDESCICVFNRDRALKSNITSNPFGDRVEKDIHDDRLNAPLWQQAFDWLLLNNPAFSLDYFWCDEGKFHGSIRRAGDFIYYNEGKGKEDLLKKLIQNIENEKV